MCQLTVAGAVLASVAVLAAAYVPTTQGMLEETDEYFKLPEGFIFGAGSSALQVEGGWTEDGKEPGTVDWFVDLAQSYGYQAGGMDVPYVAADSYHRWREDVAAAKELKMQAYRFSVSWARVLLGGDVTKPNKKGIEYYHNLIDALLEAGIQPLITMLHLDVPISVTMQVGSWANSSIVPIFEAYADFLFKEYGDKVKLWTTINEPNYFCLEMGVWDIPGIHQRQIGDDYKCIHNSVLAHTRVYRLYERKYRQKQKGMIGAAALTLWCRPNSTSYEDIMAAERANMFALGSVFHPVVHGDYPDVIKEQVDFYSKLEGLPESRLPRFTEEEKSLLKGSADFLCFNIYVGTTVADGRYANHSGFNGYGTMTTDRDAVEVGTSTTGQFDDLFNQAEPYVVREALLWIRDNYPNYSVLITENGWSDETGVDPLNDSPRVGYHSEYLYELVRVAQEEKVPVMGYFVWSLLDSWEWAGNFGRKFGLVHVDYEGGTLNRTLKKSAWFFQEIGKMRRVPKVKFVKDKASVSGSAPAVSPVVVLTAALTLFRLL